MKGLIGIYIFFLSIIFCPIGNAQDFNIYFIPSPKPLSHFDDFFKKGSDKPLSKVVFFEDRIYSDNREFYIVQSPYYNSVIVKDIRGRTIKEVSNVSMDDMIIWLDKCVIIDRFYTESNKKVVINLETGEQKIYYTKGKFRHIGQTNKQSFFCSVNDYSEIEGILLKSRKSLIKINETGVEIEYINPTVTGRVLKRSIYTGKEEWNPVFSDTAITFDYYNNQFSMGSKKIGNLTVRQFIKNYNIEWNYKEHIDFFDPDMDTYYSNGYTYVLLNDKAIFRFGENEVEKIIDCEDLMIIQFIIKKDFLIFTTNRNTTDKVNQNRFLGILNLNTRKISYPKIIKK